MNNDLISREALNEIWKLYKKYQPRLAVNVYEFGVALKELIDNAPTVDRQAINAEWLKAGIEYAETHRPQSKWIPVSERLPEESLNSVIGWDAYRERCVFVQYIDGYFQITGSDESFNIVAWQPLPEPYKKGGAKMEKSNE